MIKLFVCLHDLNLFIYCLNYLFMYLIMWMKYELCQFISDCLVDYIKGRYSLVRKTKQKPSKRAI